MTAKTWNNVLGQFSIEVYSHEGKLLTINDKPIDVDIAIELSSEAIWELVIEFRSSGSYEAKSMYGGPDNLGWPEQLDEERTLEEATFVSSDKCVIRPGTLVQDELFEFFRDEIEQVTLERDD